MIAMVCQFYGWGFKDVMRMPIKTFFAFHAEAIKMEARQFRELLSISATPGMTAKYYEMLSNRYQRIISPETVDMKPPTPPEFCLEAGSEEAKAMLTNVFQLVKRGLGYV